MLAARTVAALAGLGFEAALFIGFHHLVRALLEGVEDILVAHLAGSGADEFRRLVVRGLSLGRSGCLGRSGRFRFPFAANVYASRMSDYYWWKDHLPLPTWYAFLEVNTTLGRPISADSLR